MIKPPLTKKEKEDYIDAQSKSNLCIGDIVKIVRVAKSNEAGWNNVWTPTMDQFIGHTGQISQIDSYGISLEITQGYKFPFFILELVWSQDK